MHHRYINSHVLIRIMKLSGLQILLAFLLVNISYALDGKAQELLNRRVNISAQNQNSCLVGRLFSRSEKLVTKLPMNCFRWF